MWLLWGPIGICPLLTTYKSSICTISSTCTYSNIFQILCIFPKCLMVGNFFVMFDFFFFIHFNCFPHSAVYSFCYILLTFTFFHLLSGSIIVQTIDIIIVFLSFLILFLLFPSFSVLFRSFPFFSLDVLNTMNFPLVTACKSLGLSPDLDKSDIMKMTLTNIDREIALHLTRTFPDLHDKIDPSFFDDIEIAF
jgi:hypothetical protein